MWKIKQVFSSIPGQVLDFMVVLIGLVIIFKKQIRTLLDSIFKEINKQTKEVYWFEITIQQVCAHAALTVRTHRPESKNPISEANLEWIFARNYEGTE